MYVSLKMNMVEAGQALKNYDIPPGRMRLLSGIKDSLIIDDTYNSSPFACLSNRMYWLTIGKMLSIKMAIVWCIRDGRPFNKLRDKPVSHFAYDGKYGYTKNFSDPEIKTEDIEYDIIKLY